MKVKVNASTMVKPETASPATAVWTSNLDVIMPANLHIPTLYFYTSTGADDFFDTAALKASLSRTLVEFYPLAGRLNKDVDGRVEINCNGEGALFVEAECDGAVVDDFADLTPKPELDLIPKVDYSQGISTFPLLLVQVTRFICGGVSLGFANQHQVVDGFANNHFINTWAEISRSLDISTHPFLDRRVLSACDLPRPQFPHVEYLPPPTLKNSKENYEAFDTIFSVFKLTRDQLNALKARCLRGEANRVKYTSYETLAGHIWRCVCMARGLSEDQETKLYIPLDGRSRLRPPLPPGYLGNVVFKATCVALCGELESNPLEFAVGKIRAAIARMDDDYLRSAIDYLEIHGDVDPSARGAAAFKCPNLGIVSWAKFGFDGADFGWGCPLHLGFCGSPPEGSAIVLPSPANVDSLFFAIALPKDKMHTFEKLFYEI